MEASAVDSFLGLWRAVGPGVLFAAAAVGVSHLVQSTRAGAAYGLGLVGLVVLANVVKYPAFRFGPHYAAATGTSLLEGYRRQGQWALVLYFVLTLGTMFTVQAAVVLVTAGLVLALFPLPADPIVLSAALLLVGAAVLAWGQYRWLDRLTKVLVAVLTLSTLAATALALPRVQLGTLTVLPPALLSDRATLFFCAALVGWMPSAIDVAVWQSLWTLARGADVRSRPSLRACTFDFHLGYVGTATLALCFIVMGAGVFHNSGEPLTPSAGGFARQIIDMYATTLGAWSVPVVGLCALAVMLSTTLTVMDGFPRALSTLFARFRSPERPGTFELQQLRRKRTYWLSLGALTLGALAVLSLVLSSLQALVDVATTLSFLTAPVLSWLNHRAVSAQEVPPEARPSRRLLVFSGVCIGVQGLFAVAYLVVRYVL